MSNGFAVRPVLWERFKQGARTHKRNPSRLLSNYMRQCLEVWEDQTLDEDIRRGAAHCGHRENDAVSVVRQYRGILKA